MSSTSLSWATPNEHSVRNVASALLLLVPRTLVLKLISDVAFRDPDSGEGSLNKLSLREWFEIEVLDGVSVSDSIRVLSVMYCTVFSIGLELTLLQPSKHVLNPLGTD
jgi:hypothetical protein